MRPAGHATLVLPALLLALTTTPILADVEVDLSAIGGPTEADARIAPGKAPVQLRYPGETPPTRILLTPPASIRQSDEAPKILGPADATAVEIEPAATTPPPSPPAPAPAPTERAAAPAPQNASPAAAAPQPPVAPLTPSAPRAPSAAAAANPAPVPPVSAPAPTAASAASAPTAAPTGAVEEPPVQVASLPPAQTANHRLQFEGNTADILGDARDELELVAMELMRHDDRIEIQAFAGEAGDVSSDARRLSLKRALNVRKFLVERGVLQSRIDVRALGGARDSGPADRVDILLSSR